MLSFTIFGCGQSTTSLSSAEPATVRDMDADLPRPTMDASSGDSSTLRLEVEGFGNENGAAASVTLREDDGIWLDLGSGLTGGGFIQLRLFLPGPLDFLGEHQISISLPIPSSTPRTGNSDPEAAMAGNASALLDGKNYYSQGGEALFNLQDNGQVSGRFTIEFANLPPLEPGQTPDFQRLSDFRTVTGSFSGGWTLSCYSRVIAHPTWLPGGAYCTALGY